MGRRKIEMKYIGNSITRRVTFAKRRAEIFKKADALAKLCNAEVGVLINSPAGRPYVFKSPCFNSMVERFRNPYPQRRSSSSLKEDSILENQTELNCLTKEMEGHKERVKVFKKRLEEVFENCNMEELVALKKKLETFRDQLKIKHVKMEASSSIDAREEYEDEDEDDDKEEEEDIV